MQLLADDIAPYIFGGLGLGFVLFLLLLLLVTTVLWIWMMVDCITNEALDGTERLVWVLVIFFSHFLGSILYYLLVRSKRGKAGI